MKRIITLVVSLLIATATFAQVPQGFSYQAVVRDAQNAIVANQTVDVTITILQGTDAESAKAVFSEKHSSQTNANGLFTLTIGSVDATNFSTINWAEGSLFLKTESDYGTAITQLLSVPFAIYAAKAAEVEVDLSGYALKSEIPTMPDLSGYAMKTDIPTEPDLNDYVTTTKLKDTLVVYALKSDIPTIPNIPTKTSELQNDKGFLTEHQDLSAYALKTDLPTDANLSDYYSKSEIDALLANLSTNEGTNTVSVTAGANGMVKGASGKFYSGQSLTYTAVPNSGYYFSGWSDYNNDNPRTIIIYSDITLSAGFAQNPLVTVTSGNNGSVSGSNNGRYAPGSYLSYTATPDAGYFFSQWSDGSSSNPRYVNVYRSDITLEAQFAQNPLVTVTAENGTISGSENGRYAPGSNLSFTATPSTGYCFSQWSDGSTDNPRTITVSTNDITLTAEFVTATIATVDLGLTSGNLWATCNVGAINPWNYGCYYAWGETKIKTEYDWSTYKYCNGSYNSLTKYNNYAGCGTVDNKTTLETSDDVATAAFGSDYSIPTIADWEELSAQCYWVETNNYNEQNVNGFIVYRAKSDEDKGVKDCVGYIPQASASYSLSDTHIFFPAAGCRYNSNLDHTDSYLY